MTAPRPDLPTIEAWWFGLEAPPDRLEQWRGWMSAEERRRAGRYLDPAQGERYLAAHAHLRWILAARLGCAPGDVEFARAANGKPHLAGGGLFFNLSHSHRLGLLAVHLNAEVGADIEYWRRPRNWPGLARRCFTPAECAWLEQQPATETASHFCRLWTIKEAWMKADGRGLAGLHQPEVAFNGTEPRLTALGRAWFAQEGALERDGYRAAVVAAGAAAVNWAALTLDS